MTGRARLLLMMALGQAAAALGQPFSLPTPNQAIFEPGKETDYFTPTVSRTWPSGTFGCVRSEGWQMHEGIDIKCTQRDAKGEPVDPVSAAADGTVVYFNAKPGLSNYGNYIVMQHEIDQLTMYTLYAHLRQMAEGLSVGQAKKTGEIIATMGRTSNTSQGISRERAHLHFEICLLANPNFSAWYKKICRDNEMITAGGTARTSLASIPGSSSSVSERPEPGSRRSVCGNSSVDNRYSTACWFTRRTSNGPSATPAWSIRPPHPMPSPVTRYHWILMASPFVASPGMPEPSATTSQSNC